MKLTKKSVIIEKRKNLKLIDVHTLLKSLLQNVFKSITKVHQQSTLNHYQIKYISCTNIEVD